MADNNNMTKDTDTDADGEADADAETSVDTCCHSALLTWLKCSGNAHQIDTLA